jgi:UDP-N-acetylmuramoyl-L-alanyl-D-glutamate--2,6-diaminopimelate ligase
VSDRHILALLAGTGAVSATGADPAVSGIAYRSDRVRPGDAFFAVRGFTHDGHDFVADAAARGACAAIVEREIAGVGIAQLVVPDARAALAFAARAFFGDPSRALHLFGVTGTNGKTTTTYLLDSILRAAGHTTGLVGTVETRIASQRRVAACTTPESADLQALLAQMREVGVTAASLEVSSHAIDLGRVDGLAFAAVAFTNLTQDHLDYHHTLEEYSSVKRRLFTDFEARARVINIDDALGRAMAEELGVDFTVGRTPDASVRAAAERADAHGTTFSIEAPGGTRNVRLPLAGAYNVSNALVAAGCALSIGVELDTVASGLETAPQVPGRLERVGSGRPFSVVVDYAHTPDSLDKAIRAIRTVTPGRVIVVFGCGGDRDPEKRPLMGRAAGSLADLAILTSDNPRSEDPVGIILQVEDGLRAVGATWQAEVDRRTAIRSAVEQASEGDTVLIAGKGHEDYQIFADRTIHFDDREVAAEELERLC